MIADNINNLEIVANNDVNATTNAEDTEIEPADTDNINMAEIENDKSETENEKSKDIVMSDNNDDNPAMSDNDSPQAIPGNDNAEDSDLGENSTEDAPSPLIYGRKTNDPTKVKTSKRYRLSRLHPWNLQQAIYTWIKIRWVNQILMYLILPTCKYMNSFLKVHQTLKI